MSEISELMKELAALKRRKDTADRKAAAITKEYDDKRAEVLGLLNEEHLTSAKSGKVSAAVYQAEIIEVEDRDAFTQWIIRNKAIDALQFRPALKALQDRREDQRGGKIPGIKFGKVRRLRVTVGK